MSIAESEREQTRIKSSVTTTTKAEREVNGGAQVAARVIESASRIRIAFASACPDAGVFKAITTSLRPAPT